MKYRNMGCWGPRSPVTSNTKIAPTNPNKSVIAIHFSGNPPADRVDPACFFSDCSAAGTMASAAGCGERPDAPFPPAFPPAIAPALPSEPPASFSFSGDSCATPDAFGCPKA
jgi:hypothetical protein